MHYIKGAHISCSFITAIGTTRREYGHPVAVICPRYFMATASKDDPAEDRRPCGCCTDSKMLSPLLAKEKVYKEKKERKTSTVSVTMATFYKNG